jgi:hypothetical protein
MTYSFATAAFFGGVFALLSALLTYSGVRTAVKQTDPSVPKLPYTQEGMTLMNRPNLFVPVFFGIISLAHPEGLVTTTLGASLCLGMCVYFSLRGWAYMRAPEMRDVRPYIGTYLAFGSAVSYAIALAGNVI